MGNNAEVTTQLHPFNDSTKSGLLVSSSECGNGAAKDLRTEEGLVSCRGIAALNSIRREKTNEARATGPQSFYQIRFDESFNWLAVLKDLAAGAPISVRDRIRLEDQAQSWPTCACGHLCKAIPRMSAYSNVPSDGRLQFLGVEFSKAICAGGWRKALGVFHAIDSRTTVLLEAMGK